jgi:hypothetical protein
VLFGCHGWAVAEIVDIGGGWEMRIIKLKGYVGEKLEVRQLPLWTKYTPSSY